jgi:hypothetical protein
MGYGTHAQNNPVTTGGNASGTGGAISYSIGQVVYTTNTGGNGTVAQGLQQPYEISTTSGISEATVSLAMSAYPNPTTNHLYLKVEDFSNLNYQLFDLAGKVIESNNIISTSTLINMEEFPPAIYFINVTQNSQLIKSFKIIKN